MTNEAEGPTTFYVVTLHASKKNANLLDSAGNFRVDARRNIDYDIVPSSVWEEKKADFDVAIPISNEYNVFITFLCNGYAAKTINVHGIEKVFDVVQALFVCKAWSVNQFEKMYDIKCNLEKIDPMINFDQFGDPSKQIVLTVERKANDIEEHNGVLETTTIHENELHFFSNQSISSAIKQSGPAKHDDMTLLLRNNMKFYENIYTLVNENSSWAFHILSRLDAEGLDSPAEMSFLKGVWNQQTVGISNIGNSCYISSSIQCLNSCSLFSDFFYCFNDVFSSRNRGSPPFYEILQNKNFYKNSRIISAWSDTVKMCRGSKAFPPRALKHYIAIRNRTFNNTREQDAAEFIESLLTYLHEGLCYKKEINDSPRLSISSADSGISSNYDGSEYDIGDNSQNSQGSENNRNENSSRVLDVDGSSLGDSTEASEHASITEYEKLINSEKSIISDLFYGMTTTTMQCCCCGHRKSKNDLAMFLPLSIPNKIYYHTSCTLMLLGGSPPIKILIPLNFTIQEAIEYTKVEYNIESNLTVLEYSNGSLVRVLPSLKNISSISNCIFFYEVRPGRAYLICHLFYRRLYFIKRKIPVDFLVEEEHLKADLFEKLRRYFVKDISQADFLSKILIKRDSFNIILQCPAINVIFDDVVELFGDKLSHLTITSSKQKNDVSLKDCLEYWAKSDKVKITCEKCNSIREFDIFSTITKQPKYLIIHLKRFSYIGSGAKVNTFIDFPENNLLIGDSKYRLLATSNHIEIGLGYGHYVAYLRKEGGWYCCNDSVISEVPKPDKASSYILFYERIE